MVDIHCHILPGLDDGPDSVETSAAMAEAALEEGITHVIATPHANNRYCFDPQLMALKCAELQAQFEGRLVFATGCDFHMTFENLQEARGDPSRFTLNQRNYLLVEFGDYSIPPSMDDELHQLQLAGITPIVTHPERNPLLRMQPERLYRWIRQGCYVQVTGQSLLGKFGARAQEVAERWLDIGAVHFVSSDAHNLTTRPLRLKEAFEMVARRHGVEVAQALFRENPLAAFEGRPLPFVPELPEELGRAADAPARPRKKRLWFF